MELLIGIGWFLAITIPLVSLLALAGIHHNLHHKGTLVSPLADKIMLVIALMLIALLFGFSIPFAASDNLDAGYPKWFGDNLAWVILMYLGLVSMVFLPWQRMRGASTVTSSDMFKPILSIVVVAVLYLLLTYNFLPLFLPDGVSTSWEKLLSNNPAWVLLGLAAVIGVVLFLSWQKDPDPRKLGIAILISVALLAIVGMVSSLFGTEDMAVVQPPLLPPAAESNVLDTAKSFTEKIGLVFFPILMLGIWAALALLTIYKPFGGFAGRESPPTAKVLHWLLGATLVLHWIVPNMASELVFQGVMNSTAEYEKWLATYQKLISPFRFPYWCFMFVLGVVMWQVVKKHKVSNNDGTFTWFGKYEKLPQGVSGSTRSSGTLKGLSISNLLLVAALGMGIFFLLPDTNIGTYLQTPGNTGGIVATDAFYDVLRIGMIVAAIALWFYLVKKGGIATYGAWAILIVIAFQYYEVVSVPFNRWVMTL